MMRKLKKQFITSLTLNAKGYILLGIVYLIGLFLAFVFHVKTVQEDEIKLFFTDFIMNVTNAGTDGIKTFNSAMLGYMQFALLLFLSSTTVIGVPAIFVYIFGKGFSFGTVLCCLLKAFGMKAILVFLTAILPHILITAPCCLAYTLYCAKKAGQVYNKDFQVKKNILFPLGMSALFLCAVSIAALIQAYIEPFFIKMISQQFL